jgi:hypothetical protein
VHSVINSREQQQCSLDIYRVESTVERGHQKVITVAITAKDTPYHQDIEKQKDLNGMNRYTKKTAA